VKDKKTAAVVVTVIVFALLIVGSILLSRSAERQEEAETEEPAVEQMRVTEEAESEPQEIEPVKVPEIPQAPEVAPAETVLPDERPKPIEASIVEAPLPSPISTAKCKAESRRVAKKRRSAAPDGMVYVPGGIFVMGSAPQVGHDDESPARKVCLTGFYISRHEVTNAQFKKFVDATGYLTEAERKPGSEAGRTWRHPYGPGSSAEDMPNYPVICVSWNDANAYANWAGMRLPTEAEWEKAARGTDGRIYPWGNELAAGAMNMNIADKNSTLLWRNVAFDDGYKEIAPVGSFPGGKSVYDAEDMAGNVREWCLDWWDSEYYSTGPTNNPTGPEAGEFRVVRGGSWFVNAFGARTTHRQHHKPAGYGAATGFRCVKEAG